MGWLSDCAVALLILRLCSLFVGRVVAQWLACWTQVRKTVLSIPGSVSGFVVGLMHHKTVLSIRVSSSVLLGIELV